MRKYPITETLFALQSTTGKHRERGYYVALPSGARLLIVGPYKTACGGCDAIQPYADIWPLIAKGRAEGCHVLFEGALVSSSYGNLPTSIGKRSEEFGDDMIFAFLDTPLDICLSRIAARRAARGNFDPVNPDNTVAKFSGVYKSFDTIQRKFGRQVKWINYLKPVAEIMRLFGERVNKEPTQ